MGGTCDKHEGNGKMRTKFEPGNMMGRDRLRDIIVDRRIILKYTLNMHLTGLG
jgi:hypothetical protein